jgi:hypothetical protein
VASVVDGHPHLVVAVASSRSKGKDQNDGLNVGEQTVRAQRDHPGRAGDAAEENSRAIFPISRPNPLGVSDRGYNIVADHRARVDTDPVDRRLRSGTGFSDIKEDRMATEPTGSMLEGMQGNGPPTEAPSIPTGEGGGAQERVRAVAGTAADEAKELARQAGGQARQVAQEAKHELQTLTDQGRQELKSQAEAQTQRASQNLRTLSDETRALAEGRPDEAGPLAGYVQGVSGKLSGWADNLDRRGFDGMVAQVQGFARRRPAAFIGLCAVAGFAVSRVGRTVRSESREEIVGTQPMLPPAATSPESTSGPTTDAAAGASSPSSSSGGSEPVVLPQVEAASERARGGR